MSAKIFNYNLESSLNIASLFTLIIVTGLILPLVLISITYFIGYSEIIEEIAKALIVLSVIFKLPKFKWQILGGIIFGFLFGLSENILYLNNIFQIGNFNIFWQRFLLSVPLHIITTLIILLSAKKNKYFIIFGIIIAIIIHLLFNQSIISVFSLV